MRITAGIGLVLLAASSLWAADAPRDTAPAASEMPRISMTFESAGLRAVVSALAEAHNLNIVGGDKLSGTVTVRFNETPVLEALAVILRNGGFELVQRENSIFEIMTREEALKAREGEAIRIWICELSNADVNQVAKILVPNALPDAKQVAVDVASNKLIISATEAQWKKVEQVVQAVDIPVPQVAIQARIVEIFTDRAESLGTSFTGRFTTDKAGKDGAGSYVIDLLQDTVATETLNFDFSSQRIDAVLKLLAREKAAEVLSAPQVTTSHGRQAEIKVVNQVPVITRTVQLVDNVSVTAETITFKETGLTLTVTPRVLSDNRVEMLIEPSVLVLTGFTETDPPAPIIDTRSAKTQVVIKDGQWLVTGGLIRYNEQTVDRGIPILKDIPLLGWLFKTRSKVREKSNLVIFVSATVLNPEKINRDTRRELAEIEAHRERERLSGGPFPAPKSENSAPEDGGADSQEK